MYKQLLKYYIYLTQRVASYQCAFFLEISLKNKKANFELFILKIYVFIEMHFHGIPDITFPPTCTF